MSFRNGTLLDPYNQTFLPEKPRILDNECGRINELNLFSVFRRTHHCLGLEASDLLRN